MLIKTVFLIQTWLGGTNHMNNWLHSNRSTSKYSLYQLLVPRAPRNLKKQLV